MKKSLSTTKEASFDSVSPTAWIVAYRRTLTDIPYSQEIFDEFEEIRKISGLPPIAEELKTPAIAPQIEARYKAVNHLLKECGINNILEMASGISPRGLELTRDPKIQYVETDLEAMIDQKKQIVNKILSQEKKRPNLHLTTADSLDLDLLLEAASLLNTSEPIAVINEGLLRYLDFDDKAKVAKNVKELLKRFGGFWITPDITLKWILNSEIDAAKDIKRINKLTGINVYNNSFDDVDQAVEFFQNIGFKVKRYSWIDIIGELSSPAKLDQPKEVTRSLINQGQAFVMHI